MLRRFAKAPRKLADLGDDYFATQHHNETIQQQDLRPLAPPGLPVARWQRA